MTEKRRSRYATVDLKKLSDTHPDLVRKLEGAREYWEHDCFVLMPEHDPTARLALMAYANNTRNSGLAAKMRKWVAGIMRRKGGMKEFETNGHKRSREDNFGNV